MPASCRLPAAFKQGLFPVVQLIKSSLHLFCLYAVPEDVGVVPSIIKSNIFARFLAVLICHIEWLLIADTSNNSQIFSARAKSQLYFLENSLTASLVLWYSQAIDRTIL